MPFTEEQKSEIISIWNAQVRKARVPELPHYTAFGELSMFDRMPLWMQAADKTVWVETSDLRTLVLTGGTDTLTPVLEGDPMLYEVPAADAGGDIAAIPSLAGKTFFLRREGRPMSVNEYATLAGGGFRLTTPGDLLIEGQRYDYQVYRMEGSDPGQGNIATGQGSMFNGVEQVTTNKTLTAANAGRLQQLRSGSTRITLMLADLATQPDNSIVAIEASISNTVQNRIAPQAGQYVYMNGTAYDEIFISPGESVWLFKATDGYYVIGGDVASAYRNLAMPIAVYKDTVDMLICEGQLLLRAEYPRLWKEVETFSASLGLVTETTWATDPQTYIGCFTSGDGTTNFRIPNLMGQFIRGLKRSPDNERTHNGPGGLQGHKVGSHKHGLKYGMNGTDGLANGQFIYDGTNMEGNTQGINTLAVQLNEPDGTKTRPENIGLFWAIKF